MAEQTSPILPQPVAILVGASSGIGAALARELAVQGWRVVLVARRAEALQRLAEDIDRRVGPGRAFVQPMDAREYDRIPELYQRVLREQGRLDAVIYSAGVMHPVAPDKYNFAKDREMLEVNLVAAVAWLGQAAALFQNLGRGHLVGISSVAGDRGRILNPAYHASKAGLTTYLESLRNRLTRRGVHVLTVKPGFVDTPMLRQAPPKRLFWVISPEQAARDIVHAMKKRKQVIYTPARWRWLMLIIQHIPSVIFRRLNF
ncbi:MAG: SDR family NAD(P)-dependent oxidoreductase [Chloroflexi bacterium]|nr:SDR family NAD(P)-dependent oxidoreductase [Chloroflexota bacterium]